LELSRLLLKYIHRRIVVFRNDKEAQRESARIRLHQQNKRETRIARRRTNRELRLMLLAQEINILESDPQAEIETPAGSIDLTD
jgi:hypothetical protein